MIRAKKTVELECSVSAVTVRNYLSDISDTPIGFSPSTWKRRTRQFVGKVEADGFKLSPRTIAYIDPPVIVGRFFERNGKTTINLAIKQGWYTAGMLWFFLASLLLGALIFWSKHGERDPLLVFFFAFGGAVCITMIVVFRVLTFSEADAFISKLKSEFK